MKMNMAMTRAMSIYQENAIENDHDKADAVDDKGDGGDDEANGGGQVRQRRSYGREDRQKSTYQSLCDLHSFQIFIDIKCQN